jgi:hypothetical protein
MSRAPFAPDVGPIWLLSFKPPSFNISGALNCELINFGNS